MKFRKKPVVIEAQLFRNALSGLEIAKWCNGQFENRGDECFILIRTLEGNHLATMGDWVIKGVKGEFYPCKPDIFKLTYEKV